MDLALYCKIKRAVPAILLGLGLFMAFWTFSLDFPWKSVFETGPEGIVRIPLPNAMPFAADVSFPIGYLYGSIVPGFLLLLYKSRRYFYPAPQKHERMLQGTALLFLMVSLIPGPQGEIFVIYLLLSSTAAVFILAGVYRAGAARPLLHKLGNLFGWMYERLLAMKSKHFILSLAAISLAMNLSAAYYLFDFKPHVIDSVDQFFHAKIIATGHVRAVSHPLPEFFDLPLMINDGHWYSQYPPGHLVLIAAGLLLGAPGLVNPLLGTLTLAILYGLARSIYDEKTARLAALLGLASPFILFMSSEYMSHASALFFCTLFYFFFVQTVQKSNIGYAFAAGSCLGLLFLIRPYSAVAVTLPACLYFVFLFIRRPELYWQRTGALAIAALLGLALFLLFNYATTGDPLTTGYGKVWNKHTLPGFNEENHHTIGKGIKQTLNNLNALQKYLFEWPVPSLLFVVLLFAFGGLNRWDVLFACSFASLALFYLFYYYQDYCFGPRFYYESAAMAVLLTSRGILRTIRHLCAVTGVAVARLRNQWLLVITLMSVVAFCVHVPDLVRVYHNNYFGVKTDYYAQVQDANLSKALVFVHRDFLTFFIHNSTDLAGPIVFAADRGTENERLMAAYPERRCYLFEEGRIDEIGPPPAGSSRLEAESLRVRVGTTMVQVISARQTHEYWSGRRYVLFNAKSLADSIVFDFHVPSSGRYKMSVFFAKASHFGVVRLTVDDHALAATLDAFVPGKKIVSSSETTLGLMYLEQGEHSLTIRATGKNRYSSGYAFGLDCIRLIPQ